MRAIDKKPSSWIPTMVAAFNSGFWLRDLHFGGYFYNGIVVRTLVAGQSALAINKAGHLQVGMWGREFTSTATLMVVRENMKLVIDNYHDISAQLEPRQKNLIVLVSRLKNRSLLGAPIQPQIYHKPSIYFARFKKDFIVASLAK